MRYDYLPCFFKKFKFIRYLQPYFKHHTILASTLIAGIIGLIVQYIITRVYTFQVYNANWNATNIKQIGILLFISFIISGLFGFAMKASRLFPYLTKSYYKKLGPVHAAYTDGVSGLVVQSTMIAIYLGKQGILSLM
jgi:hypothetical protein